MGQVRTWLNRLAVLIGAACATTCCGGAEPFVLPLADGYRGLWYSNQKTGDEYVYKYSGGMATYPQQHMPIAIYAPAARKTFPMRNAHDMRSQVSWRPSVRGSGACAARSSP